MKKSLLALAVLGAFAGAAQAQSSVTIYGIVDTGVTFTNKVGTGNLTGD
ncbi:MAG TPA: porin, partial [Herbaspirillum sp.]|nr:porin [Herbaspirillum sp.]